MKISVKVRGVERHFDVRKMEVEKNDNRWELLVLATEDRIPPPVEIELVLLAWSSEQVFIEKLSGMIRDHGGVSSHKEFEQMVKEALKR